MRELARSAVDDHGACQDAGELSMLLDVLADRFPLSHVLEIGSDRGGMLWLWGHVSKWVTAVTLHSRSDGIFEHHGASVFELDSTTPDTKAMLREIVPSNPLDLVFVDGDHSYRAALSDIALARELCPRGLVVVHDIYPRDDYPQIETHLAWNEVAETSPHAEIYRELGVTPGYGILWPAT